MGEQPEESDNQGEIGSCEITSLFNITNHIIVSRRWLDLRPDILWTWEKLRRAKIGVPIVKTQPPRSQATALTSLWGQLETHRFKV